MVIVQNDGIPIAQLRRSFFRAHSGQVYLLYLAGAQDPDERHAPLLRRAPRPSRQPQYAQLRANSPEVALLGDGGGLRQRGPPPMTRCSVVSVGVNRLWHRDPPQRRRSTFLAPRPSSPHTPHR